MTQPSLRTRIQAMIATDGPMPLERYMALALGDPAQGYYTTRDPFGAAGDFITAPEISQMFGELLGLWAAETWAQMGAPAQVNLVELGPGRGTLMADALRAAKVAPKFLAAVQVHLVETSPVLRAAQEKALAQAGVPVTWHERVGDVPDGPVLVLANEFFDALPVRHYVRNETGWHERLVGLNPEGQALCWGLSPVPEPSVSVVAAPGAVLEVAPLSHQIMAELAGRLMRAGGAALVIDYGHATSQLGETLQALQAHKMVDPLAEPGEADLTTHVDFAALARAAAQAGCHTYGPVTQGTFLQRLGIVARAESLKRRASPPQAAQIDMALARLTQASPTRGSASEAAAAASGMGSLFKVMVVAHPQVDVPAGFRPEERRP